MIDVVNTLNRVVTARYPIVNSKLTASCGNSVEMHTTLIIAFAF